MGGKFKDSIVKPIIGGLSGLKKLGGMFKQPKLPKAQEPPQAPTIDEAKARRIEQDRLLRRRGRAATVLSSGSGSGSVGVSKLLGGGA